MAPPASSGKVPRSYREAVRRRPAGLPTLRHAEGPDKVQVRPSPLGQPKAAGDPAVGRLTRMCLPGSRALCGAFWARVLFGEISESLGVPLAESVPWRKDPGTRVTGESDARIVLCGCRGGEQNDRAPGAKLLPGVTDQFAPDPLPLNALIDR